jgi:hypothetical protein
MLLGKRKYSHDPLHSLRGIDSVESRHYQVSCLCGLHRDLNCFTIAHLSHQDNFRSLTQRRPQRQGKARGVGMQFTLMNDTVLVGMKEFDWVLDREDVKRVLLVYQVDDRRQS